MLGYSLSLTGYRYRGRDAIKTEPSLVTSTVSGLKGGKGKALLVYTQRQYEGKG